MMEHMELQRQHDLAVNTKLYETHRLKDEIDEAERKVEEQRLATLTEAQLRAEVESRLVAAKQQVVELAASLRARQAMYPSFAQNFDSAFEKIDKFLSNAT
jgi:hypothetical protein